MNQKSVLICENLWLKNTDVSTGCNFILQPSIGYSVTPGERINPISAFDGETNERISCKDFFTGQVLILYNIGEKTDAPLLITQLSGLIMTTANDHTRVDILVRCQFQVKKRTGMSALRFFILLDCLTS